MTMTPLRLRDRVRWTELWTAFLEHTGTAVPPEQYDFTWARLHDGRLHGLVARDGDGRISGFVHYLFHEHSATMRPACYLQDLFVDATMRAGGVGQALIEAVADRARVAGSTRLYWSTANDNAVARRLYDRIARQGAVRYDFPL